MKVEDTTTNFKKLSLLFILCLLSFFSYTQSTDSTKNILKFSGNASITNNGFSNIPSFSLGKPAAVFNLAMGGKRMSFEPELRFSLEGKPWSFLFWWRYKAVQTQKYQLGIGVHPGFNFKSENAIINGVESDYIVTRRYLTGEVNQNIVINKNFSAGLYYLYGRGIDVGTALHTHYLSLRASFSNIRLSKELSLGFSPQLFYLNTAYKNGTYFASSLGIFKKNCPFSLGFMVNKKIKSDIVAKDFNWNVSINYAFGKGTYVKK